MRTSVRSLFVAMLLLCGAASARAQNVSVVGTVADETKVGSAGRDRHGDRSRHRPPVQRGHRRRASTGC